LIIPFNSASTCSFLFFLFLLTNFLTLPITHLHFFGRFPLFSPPLVFCDFWKFCQCGWRASAWGQGRSGHCQTFMASTPCRVRSCCFFYRPFCDISLPPVGACPPRVPGRKVGSKPFASLGSFIPFSPADLVELFTCPLCNLLGNLGIPDLMLFL